MTESRPLYVAWQDPKATSWYPVGEFRHDGEAYLFQYLAGAEQAREEAEFQGIAQFPDFHLRYRSRRLFSFFQNRVVSRTRGDYDDYAKRLNLAPYEMAYELRVFEELGRSNGRRATDRFELFAAPLVRRGQAIFEFFVRGVRYLPAYLQSQWDERDPPGPYRAMLDPMNENDRNAVLLVADDRGPAPLGYVPRYYAPDVSILLKQSREAHLTLIQRNPPPAPSRERLLMCLQAKAPPDWQFASGEEFRSVEIREEVAA